MAKKKIIPTAAEVEARRKEINAQKEAERKEEVIKFLQQKTLKVLFTFQIGLEAMDFLVPTEFYQKGKDLKRDGNRFVKCLERDVEKQIDSLYRHNPDFTVNMMRETEQMIDKLAKVDFHDFPFLNQHIQNFLDNKEELSKEMQVKFSRLQK